MAIGLLITFITVIMSLGANFSVNQRMTKDIMNMRMSLNNSAEELLNKQYSSISLGTTSNTVDGFNRNISVTESANIKQIEITLSNNSGQTMKIFLEKGADIN